MAYRSSVYATTQQTPNKMVFGRDIVLPMEAVIGRPFSPEQADGAVQVEEHISKIQDRLETNHRIARQHLKVNSEYQIPKEALRHQSKETVVISRTSSVASRSNKKKGSLYQTVP